MARLTITGKGTKREIEIAPRGVLIGRSGSCDVSLDSKRVSRRHARLYQDPFERWLVEDLDSRNGVWLGRERVQHVSAVAPGQRIHIGPFELAVEQDVTESFDEPLEATASTLIVDGPSSETLTPQDTTAGDLAAAHLRQLNEIADRVAEIADLGELYGEVCDGLAEEFREGGESAHPASGADRSMALVLRLPVASEPLPDAPRVLAFSLGGARRDAQEARNLHLSRRVLEFVRGQQRAVLASNTGAGQGRMDLTVVDEGKPRSVCCAPIGRTDGDVDLVYVDLPSDRGTAAYRDFLQAVARHVGSQRRQLAMAKARADRQALDRQLEMARTIQQRLTPSDFSVAGGVDVALHSEPAMWVGGDYCDVWQLPQGLIALAVGDVSGKGLPAAMVMTHLQAALRATMSFCHDPAEIMRHVNEQLSASLPENMFVTFFLGLYDPAAGTLCYVNAGHVPAVQIHPSGATELWTEPRNVPLGIIEETYQPATRALPPGSAVVVVTDGVTEAPDPDGNLLSVPGLERAVAGSTWTSARDLVRRVVDHTETYRQTMPQQDDVTVLALVRPGDVAETRCTAG